MPTSFNKCQAPTSNAEPCSLWRDKTQSTHYEHEHARTHTHTRKGILLKHDQIPFFLFHPKPRSEISFKCRLKKKTLAGSQNTQVVGFNLIPQLKVKTEISAHSLECHKALLGWLYQNRFSTTTNPTLSLFLTHTLFHTHTQMHTRQHLHTVVCNGVMTWQVTPVVDSKNRKAF